MALIECPDCSEKVSDRAEACPKCARPIARGGAQTIEKTSKKLKGWLATWFSVFLLALLIFFIAGSTESVAWAVIGLLLFLASSVGMGVVKMKIWWEHE